MLVNKWGYELRSAYIAESTKPLLEHHPVSLEYIEYIYFVGSNSTF